MLLKFFPRRKTFPFDTGQGLIIVEAAIVGSSGGYIARLALDTGASGTLISHDILLDAGYELSAITDRVPMTTGSGSETVPRLPIMKLIALGQERRDFPVVAHTLPPPAIVDGLLGLDFFRQQKLTLDFRNGIIVLSWLRTLCLCGSNPLFTPARMPLPAMRSRSPSPALLSRRRYA